MFNETQKKVLILHSRGKKPREIAEIAKIKVRTVREALKRGRNNLDKSIENIEFSIRNNLLNDKQVRALKEILNEL